MKTTTNVAAATARNSAGAGSAALVQGRAVGVLVSVGAVSGTGPSLAISLEWSNDGTTWFTADPADTMTAITAVSNKVKSFDAKAAYVRPAWAITGTTPSFTFSVDIFTID